MFGFSPEDTDFFFSVMLALSPTTLLAQPLLATRPRLLRPIEPSSRASPVVAWSWLDPSHEKLHAIEMLGVGWPDHPPTSFYILGVAKLVGLEAPPPRSDVRKTQLHETAPRSRCRYVLS